MDLFTGIITYLLIWWTALFTVLPWGVRRAQGGPDETSPGAPENPKLKQKLIITTGLSAVLWLILFSAVELEIINFHEISSKMMHEDMP